MKKHLVLFKLPLRYKKAICLLNDMNFIKERHFNEYDFSEMNEECLRGLYILLIK